MSVPCNASVLGGGPAYCNLWSYDPASGRFAKTPRLTAVGNIDPALGSYFPANARVPSPAQVPSQAGLPLVNQSGWGGGANVTLGPQEGMCWGVHSTPSTFASTSTTAAVLLSWHLGAHALNESSARGALVNTSSPAAFVPSGLTFAVNVTLAARNSPSQRLLSLKPTCLRYRRAFTAAAVAGHAYTSPLICHALVSGLAPATSYNFSLLASVVNGSAVTLYGTPRNPGAPPLPYGFNTAPLAGAAVYPLRWAVTADVGQTFNSSMTAQYMAQYADSLGGTSRAGVDVLLSVGDFSYADNYGPTDQLQTCWQTGAPCGTMQQRWDSAFTMWQPVIGRSTAVHAAGNHELEIDGISAMRLTPNDTAATYGVDKGNYPFQSYATRLPNGAMDPRQWGDIHSAQFYSQNLGAVHVAVLNNYIPFAPGSPQHSWFVADLRAVDRSKTPWLLVAVHASPMHTYYTHYKEMECFMSIYEPLFLQYRVDMVFSGHIHAYQRTHPVYQYQRNDCGPVYVTIGDGGNIEGPYRDFVDDLVPGSNVTYCEAAWGAALRATPGSNAANGLPPSYQSQVHPVGCPTVSYQRASGVAGGAGVLADPASPDRFFCQSSQPTWSAYRDPSFGFASLTFNSSMQATLTWYRNVDQASGQALRGADKVTYTRFTGTCGAPLPPPPPKAASPQAKKSGGGGTFVAAFLVVLAIAGAGAICWWRNKDAAAVAGAPEDAPEARLLGPQEAAPTRQVALSVLAKTTTA